MKITALLLVCLLLLAACRNQTLFTQQASAHTGIHFSNKITETDSLNPLNNVNIYNGGGVGIGDFNGDSLPDLYFTGNIVPNKMYLNRGGFRFEDVTEAAHVAGSGRWCRGAAVVDINADGRPDLYVSASISKNGAQRKNLLYINRGNNKSGTPVFEEQAAAWGLDDTTHTTMSLFFDYDNDGDLDVYLAVNEHLATDDPNRFRPAITNGTHPSTGRLYRNDWNASLQHGVFKNVSADAGITTEGYSHAAIITDINNDGWKDIYATNDFLSNNILYINNGDGTFTNRVKDYFKQTSTFAMGVDVEDINNDALPDVVELDMNPQDNYRKKMMLGANSYQTYQNFDHYSYQYQYSRNSLQLNSGNAVGENDSISHPVFSQVAYAAGIAETDWSWTPLLTDFDNDGFRDLIVTNGYRKDVTDRDFMTYRDKASSIASIADIMRQIPEVKLHNYAFQNKGDGTFADVSAAWGFEKVSFSNGAAYADLDGDGDMDVVVNNINDEAFVYQNNAAKSARHYLNITLQGTGANRDALGAWLRLYYNGRQQVYEYTPYRGYLSTIQNKAHFGLDTTTVIDSVVVIWPDHKKTVVKNVAANQTIKLTETNTAAPYSFPKNGLDTAALFRDVTSASGLAFQHRQKDFIDFNIQKLLPHKFSEYTPALAAGDVDGNGLDDLVCGGTSAAPAALFLQQANGAFTQQLLFKTPPPPPASPYETIGFAYKNAGLLLFDADGDGDLDLYAASGGYEHAANTAAYQDRFYINDGKGHFAFDSAALPQNFTSKFCVRACDYDKDGDLDLFVAGRVAPWQYPKPVSSFIFRNDTKGGHPKFTDVTATAAPDLLNAGLVCDGVFSDVDSDGWPDLVLAGEWMPVLVLKNEHGVLKKLATTGMDDKTGWWNTLAPGDFDNDGDVDFIAGNVGLNTFYKASARYPVSITAADFDNNGSYDAFPSLYLPVSQQDTTRKDVPAHGREDAIKQMIGLRSRFLSYRPFAMATMADVLTDTERKSALRLQATTMASCFLRNNGGGKFTAVPLPVPAQVSVLCGLAVLDTDGDGNLDVVMNGNDYGTDVSVGRADALNGLLLKGDGRGHFSPQTILQSGIYIPGDGKALVQLRRRDGKLLLAASQYGGPLKMFALKQPPLFVPLQPGDASARIRYRDGRVQKQEGYYGYSFLSQSGRFLTLTGAVAAVEITDNSGVVRTVPLR